ncbi:MAG: hypothetical protein ACF8CQ_19940 [Rhodopirellula sp. JB044]|uniref:hypothetical protein n=1 Tax=Rhodopirellula sp. JB044 TaxID=3342844 RepID=UPI00370C8952
MARKEADREDLLAEGVNLPERGRLTNDLTKHEYVLGWRSPQAVSVFDGVDPVFQFNTSGHLRRVYFEGEKLAANENRLTRLVRAASTNGQMKLQPHPLSDDEQAKVCQRLAETKSALLHLIQSGSPRVEAVGMEDDEFLQRVRNWCAVKTPPKIAAVPNIGG